MRKKINVKLITVVVSIILLIIVAGLIIYTKTDFFRTKRSAFFRYFNNTSDILGILETDKFKDYNERKQTIPYYRKADITIQNSTNIADSNILDKVKLTLSEKNDNKNEKFNMRCLLKKDSNILADATVVRDKDICGIFWEEVSNSFIAVKNDDLKRIAKDIGIENSMIIPNEYNNINPEKVLETSKLEKKHISECLKIIRNDVPNNAYSKLGKKKIKINDNSYSTTAYSLELDANASGNLEIELLNKISKDSILMDYLVSKCKLLNFDEEYTTINSMNDIIKKKISELQANPSSAGKITITVYEHKQKNIRTEIKIGDNTTIQIDHLKEDVSETSSIKYNNQLYKIQFNGTNYSLVYEDTSENGKKIKVDYNQSGTIENNDIKNNAVITISQGIKSITYSYKDTIEFTSNIENISTFGDVNTAILNDYSDEEIIEFVKTIKERINSIYVNKGADIGVNLDPLFDI